ncbi:unnamed protein product [Ilex paraguariensis]|uniref:F-box domain-containing protein n=1 Tax=Ilex paraguariensis TaxID=185542 RepID=A0ABC8UDU4_9AQUA
MEKKNTRTRGGAGGGNAKRRGVGGVSRLPLDMVIEVLTCLPAKSLLRLKCVSKLWCTTIGGPSFSNAYRDRSSSRSTILLTYHDSHHLFCFYATLPCLGESFHHRWIPSRDKFDARALVLHHWTLPLSIPDGGVTQVINGLFCFYSGHCASLCNISTHEIMQLPSSNHKSKDPYPDYYFGFDAIAEEYKLLKSYGDGHKTKINYTPKCEIITLGKDASWRRIDKWKIIWTQSFCVNGVLYWMNPNRRPWDLDDMHNFIAFDLKEEQFQELPQPPASSKQGDLVQFGGKLALVHGFDDLKLKLWVLEEQGEGELRSMSWTNYESYVPDGVCNHVKWWNNSNSYQPNYPMLLQLAPPLHAQNGPDGGEHVFPVGNLPTGEILLNGGRIRSLMSVYSYDHNGKFKEIDIGQLPETPDLVERKGDVFRLYYHEENVTPLKDLISSKQFDKK